MQTSCTERTFQIGLELVLKYEGGYVDDPDDLGGATNYGITQKTYNAYRTSKKLHIRSVAQIEMSEVKDCYRNNYWIAAKCPSLPPKTAIAHFDWSVNAGVKRGITTLQLVTGALPDGIFGNATLNAAQQFIKKHGDFALAEAYLNRRNAYYSAWANGNQAKFLNGWLNRSNHLRMALKKSSDLA